MEISRFISTRFLGWRLLSAIASFLLSLPILMLFFRMGRDLIWGNVALNHLLLFSYVENTFYLTLGVGALSLVLGIVPAWLVSTSEFPFRKSLEWLLVLPLSIPAFICGIAYSGLTDYAGPIRTFLRAVPLLPDFYMDVLTRPGLVLVMSVVLFPYVYLISRSVFITRYGSLIEASRNLGLSKTKTFLSVVLPNSWPAVFSGLTLVVMEVLNDYGTVKYFGVSTFTEGIFREWLALGNLSSAISLSVILLCLVLVLLFIEASFNRRKNYSTLNSGIHSRYHLRGKTKYLATAACFFPFLMGFVIPVFQMLYWLYFQFETFDWLELFAIAVNTLLLSSSTGIILVTLGILIVFTTRIVNSKNALSRLSSKILLLGYATPGAVIGVGVIIFVSLLDSSLIYSGVSALVFGYSVRYFAVSHNPLLSGLAKHSGHLEEAAFSLGAKVPRVLTALFLPLLKPSVMAALMLVFVDVSKELSLTLILRPFNFETLATHAFQYAKDEMPASSAPASLFIILVGSIPIYYLNKAMSRA